MVKRIPVKIDRNYLATYKGKRVLDVLLSVFSVVCLLPIIGLVGIGVRMRMGSPILFRQKRPGLHGLPFVLNKFRTMTDDRDNNNQLLPDGQRLTSLGRFLRKTSLDELPELWNVLRGDMSLVGPRPLLFRYLPHYRPRENKRHLAQPGITGLAQISGRNLLSWDDRLELDANYVERISLALDIKILAKTFFAVLGRKGVSADVDKAETWLDEERSALNAD